MAGLGRRTFAAGEVLTASNVMGYLQDQAVMNFAGTAARGTALGTAVSEGMVSYLADSNTVEVYDGSAWKQVYTPAGVTGSVVQVVQTNKTNVFSTTTTGSWVDVTGFSASITPKSASNKIVVVANFMATASTTAIWQFRLVRNSTAIGGGDNSATVRQSAMTGVIFDAGAGFTQYNAYAQSFNFMDSPATTSATTYKLQAWATGASTMYIGRSQNWGNATDYAAWSSNLLLMEVAG